MAAPRQRANIKVSEQTRNRVRRLKRGGQSYDELLQAMADQYDPTQAAARGTP